MDEAACGANDRQHRGAYGRARKMRLVRYRPPRSCRPAAVLPPPPATALPPAALLRTAKCGRMMLIA